MHPGTEPNQTRAPHVPEQAISPEPATQAPESGQAQAQPVAFHESDPPDSEDERPTDPGLTASASGDDEHAESIVLIEPLPSLAGGRAARAAASRVSSAVRGTATLARRYKLETIAVLLLGVGGAVYPPVWVLGALMALPSKTWDLRDKWTGLVAPVLLVIASTVVILVIGGKHNGLGSYALEAWLGASRVSRVAAVLGACYLAWRLRTGRREPKQPPWNVPHRLG